jgi:hypothetical protein
LPSGKKILSVCNLHQKRCTFPTMHEKSAEYFAEIAEVRVFKAELAEKDG